MTIPASLDLDRVLEAALGAVHSAMRAQAVVALRAIELPLFASTRD
jgi:hypothetical protein